MSTRTVWIDASAGVAGDMLLAALLDAGADRTAVDRALAALAIPELDGLRLRTVWRGGVRGSHVEMLRHPHAPGDPGDLLHVHRPARDVLALLTDAPLDDDVRALAIRVYRTLAEVEGAIHGSDPDDVELHEVGAVDSIADVVSVCAAVVSLAPGRLVTGPIGLSHGTVLTAHGPMPTPVPAVTELAARFELPVVGLDSPIETATPTGVALLAVLADDHGAIPPMTVTAVGVGAGSADPPGRPNVVRALIGTQVGERPHLADLPDPSPLHLVETNVDDISGEVLARTIEALFEAGALDAWITPTVMKKGRPAHTVHALCSGEGRDDVVTAMLRETGSLGVRASTVDRWAAPRDEITVHVEGQPIRVKRSGHRLKVEHDDALAAATALDVPLREVLVRAESAAAGRAHAE